MDRVDMKSLTHLHSSSVSYPVSVLGVLFVRLLHGSNVLTFLGQPALTFLGQPALTFLGEQLG